MEWSDIPNYKLGDAPEELTGIPYRLVVAKRALRAGYEELEDYTITDMLADLRHLCDALGLDYGKLDDMAYQHYTEEKRGEA